VDHPEQLQDDEDHDNNDQHMDPIAGAREPWTDVPAEESKQPKDYENNDDCPQHEISPIE
jgi:hypothetical protein